MFITVSHEPVEVIPTIRNLQILLTLFNKCWRNGYNFTCKDMQGLTLTLNPILIIIKHRTRIMTCPGLFYQPLARIMENRTMCIYNRKWNKNWRAVNQIPLHRGTHATWMSRCGHGEGDGWHVIPHLAHAESTGKVPKGDARVITEVKKRGEYNMLEPRWRPLLEAFASLSVFLVFF